MVGHRSSSQAYGLGGVSHGCTALALDLAQQTATDLIQVEYIDKDAGPSGDISPPDLTPTDHHALLRAWLNPAWRHALTQLMAGFKNPFLVEYAKLLILAVPPLSPGPPDTGADHRHNGRQGRRPKVLA
jgi:hypothetical protein